MADEEKKEAKQEAAGEGAAKHKKVSRMTLREIEQALAEIQKSMGGFYSRHARQMLARKDVLLREGESL